ncbi:MAG: hypothetical protein WB613_23120 [Pseudolabrys sp.]|jgi:hypothetical protein
MLGEPMPKWRKAQKQHQCQSCAKVIAYGERYLDRPLREPAHSAVVYAVSFARRFSEQNDYDVSNAALRTVVALNAKYVEAKGKTFFASNAFIENPLSRDAFISDTLEHSSDLRRPYVVAGVFPQRFHIDRVDQVERVKSRLAKALAAYRDLLASSERSGNAKRIASLKETIAILEREYEHFAKLADGTAKP